MGFFAWFNSYGPYVLAALVALYAVTRLMRERRSRARKRLPTREIELGVKFPDAFVDPPTGGSDTPLTPSEFGGEQGGDAGGGAAWTAVPVPIDDVADAGANDAPTSRSTLISTRILELRISGSSSAASSENARWIPLKAVSVGRA